MASSTVFISNRSQAVRLPKAVAFPEGVHQVDFLRIGRSRVIVPQGKRWDDLFQHGPRASEISWLSVNSRRPRSASGPDALACYQQHARVRPHAWRQS
jgi:antitoxin VapB